MNKRDQYLNEIIDRLLETGEEVLNTGTVFQGPPALNFLHKHFYAILTNKRIILIESTMGLTGIDLRLLNMIDINISDLKGIKQGGFLNQKKLILYKKNGESIKLKYNTMVRQLSGHKQFCKEALQNISKMVQENT